MRLVTVARCFSLSFRRSRRESIGHERAGKVTQHRMLVTRLDPISLAHCRKFARRVQGDAKRTIERGKSQGRQSVEFDCGHNFLKPCSTFFADAVQPEGRGQHVIARFRRGTDQPVEPLRRQQFAGIGEFNTIVINLDRGAGAANTEILVNQCVGDQFKLQ